MTTYWTNLSERDRWAAGLGLAFLVCYMFYLLVYSPLTTAVVDNSKQLTEKKETLAWMKQVQQDAHHSQKAQIISRNKLLTVIAAQLDAGPLKPFTYQLQQTGQGDISLTFDKVPYTLFLNWLWKLNNQYAISLGQFSIERSKTAGVVKSSVLISTK